MKKISETVSMKGQQEAVTLTQLRAMPGEVFSQVALGKEFTVTKGGKAVAVIQPSDDFDWGALDRLRRIPSVVENR